MKDTLILILVISIVLTGFMPVRAFGQGVNEENLEGIILKIKELFDISDDYDNFVSRVNSYDNQVNYYLNWSDSAEKLPNISINVDSDGNVTSFNKYYYNQTTSESKLPKVTKDEAQKFALSFIEKVDSNVFKEIELKESSQTRSTWDRYYSFNYFRNINDIPYIANTVNISVDMQTGEVTDYYTNWDRNIEFPHANNLISLDEAKEAYKEKIGLELVYKQKNRARYLDGEEGDRYFLAYSTLGELKGIDGVTGESINLSYYRTLNAKEAREGSVSGAGQAPKITPEEREEIDKLKGLKTVDEIEKEARKILDLDNDYEVRGTNLSTSWDNTGEFFYSLTFVKAIDERVYYTDISLNAKTLELKSFYKASDLEAKAKPIINKAQALELAKEYINKINPDKSNQVEFLELYRRMEDNQPHYEFNFIRKIDGVYVESDGISIGVDAVNKEINSYNLNWYNGEFSAKKNIIPIDKAYEALFSEIGFDLNYNDIYNYETTEIDINREIRLVYSVNQDKPNIIDAFTGDILDRSGNIYKDSNIPEYTDIEDSYAKDRINTLAEYGVGYTSGTFKPKEIIKQKDFLLLLWQSMNPNKASSDTEIDEIYENLIRQNILKDSEENRDRAVTKEEAVKFVIRAMNYEKLAEIPGIYADIFTDGMDIDPNLKGHMTLAYGLKIIYGDGTEDIKPKYELKRQDGASIIYNYMFN